MSRLSLHSLNNDTTNEGIFDFIDNTTVTISTSSIPSPVMSSATSSCAVHSNREHVDKNMIACDPLHQQKSHHRHLIIRRSRENARNKCSLTINRISASALLFGCIFGAILFQYDSSVYFDKNDCQQKPKISNSKESALGPMLVDAFGLTKYSSRALVLNHSCCKRGGQYNLGCGGFPQSRLDALLENRATSLSINVRPCITRRIFPAKYRSLVICQSTVESETETLASYTEEQETPLHANGASMNGSHTEEQESPLHINGASMNGSHTEEQESPLHINGASMNGSRTKDLNGNLEPHQNSLINGNHAVNGNGVKIDKNNEDKTDNDNDVPVPTENGGYTHTSASKAKISAANKGKTPWNKGKERSDEVKQRIAEGVRRKNRERFLAKLAEEGITEEEYEQRKKETRRKKDQERRARKTANGGYTPTDETKKKISEILKAKYASGEIKRTPRAESSIRRGFHHSEETKQKIRESLKRKWAEDDEYREMMTNKTIASATINTPSVRKRIAETLKKKWQEPEFRATMMEKIAKRKTSSGARAVTHRQKISEAMKRKWMDDEYRNRATAGMAKGRVKPVQPKTPKTQSSRSSVKAVTAMKAVKKSKGASVKAKRTKKSSKKKSSGSNDIMAVEPLSPRSSSKSSSSKKSASSEEEKEGDGSISRMREERRDLYDLLYGDEDDDDSDGDAFTPSSLTKGGARSSSMGASTEKGRNGAEASRPKPVTKMGVNVSNQLPFLSSDDDDLDDFDPYGLDNF